MRKLASAASLKATTRQLAHPAVPDIQRASAYQAGVVKTDELRHDDTVIVGCRSRLVSPTSGEAKSLSSTFLPRGNVNSGQESTMEIIGSTSGIAIL
ncbi:MAG: hypothetical protein NT138_24065 [Planctomycetales bacterium]|nr:hypothetical protein [Planctomycetales bacterium]